jgi:hypothetical protein
LEKKPNRIYELTLRPLITIGVFGSGIVRGLVASALIFGISLSDPTAILGLNLERLSELRMSNNELLDVEYDRGFITVPGGLGGTVIVDVRNPSKPVEVSRYSDPECPYGRFYNTFFGEGLLVGAGRNCPLTLLSVSGEYGIEHLADFQTGDFSYEDVTKSGTVLYAAVHAEGIEIIDISVPTSPLTYGSIALDNAWAVRVDGDYAYVADGGSGLTIVDISDPFNPTVAGRLQTEGSAKDIRVRNGYAFLALGDAGVVMVDISDPTSPSLVAEYNTTGLAAHIGVNDSLVAVADWDDIEILDYSSGNSLELAGFKNNGGRIMGVEVAGDNIYVAEWSQLYIYRFGQISGADLDIDLVDINFPRTNIGESYDTTIVLSSNGMSTLTVDSITISLDDFTIDVTPPFDILPGSDYPVSITYTPTDDAGFQHMRIYSNDTDDTTIQIDLLGNNPDLNVGDPAPDFTLPVLDDGHVTLSELQGSVVVLSFFASW